MNPRHIIKKLRSFPGKFWPLTPWTIFIAIIALILSVEMGAIAVQRINDAAMQSHAKTPSTQSNTQNKQTVDPMGIATQNTPTASTPSSQGSTAAKPTKTTTDSGSTLDQYGCATNTPSYNQCVQNKQLIWCNGQVSAPASAFSSATLQARAAYNSVMNEWESVRYKPVHSPYSEYLADATSKFKAIYDPAYSTYFSKVQSLNSQGCSLQYPTHESPGQYW